VISERDAMAIAGMTALTAILAPVPIADDGLYRVGDGRVVAFVKVDGAADGSMVEELTDLRDVVGNWMTEVNNGCVSVLCGVVTEMANGCVSVTIPVGSNRSQ